MKGLPFKVIDKKADKTLGVMVEPGMYDSLLPTGSSAGMEKLKDVVDNGTHVVEMPKESFDEDEKLKVEKMTYAEVEEKAKENYGYCFGHKVGTGHFEKGREFPVKEVSYEDINGDIAWTFNLCEKCIKKVEAKVKREGGSLKYET